MARNQLSLNAPTLPAANAPSEIFAEAAGAGHENIAHELADACADEDRARNRTANLGSLWQRP